MLKNNQKGFSPLIIIILIVVLGIVGFAVYKVTDSKDSSKPDSSVLRQNKNTEPEADIQLQNFGVKSLDAVDINSNVLREFESKGLKGFYVFGDKLPGNRNNPNFEFSSLKEGTEVIAAIDGVVVNIEQQTENGNDYEVFVQPKDGSAWVIGYDHLINLKVKKGDKVKAGDVLGNPARQNNGALRFEMQINKGQGEESVHVCPSTILAPGKKDQLLAELKTMLTAWESQTGVELYNVESQNPVGCIKPTLTPAEAEGR